MLSTVSITRFTVLSFTYFTFGRRTHREEGREDVAHEYGHAGEPNDICVHNILLIIRI
jgi:hypothetical protein